ncbi:unnamed protein product [Nippostrongylus brasiliensis]|uniref:1-alkyl-2-acetylglycerophosphocholine esterase n=1 Tax=Nippostrongylus brasiliensis TaxID=27835 RepID=A0A0N4Y3Z2_NIPBR|nr:unnamed protein product [Nippostrongylus brasiliensis]
MGHSLGGTLSREMVAEMRLWGWEIPFVVMFDTWMVQAEQIQLERVRTFAQIAGNHESCMRAENLCTHKNTILSLFQNWL